MFTEILNYCINNLNISIWISLIVIFLVIELNTCNFYTISYVPFLLINIILDIYQVPLMFQIIFLLLASNLLYYLLLKKTIKTIGYKTFNYRPSNCDRLIGEKALVIEEISEHKNGLISVKSQIWTAAIFEENKVDSSDDRTKISVINKGEVVEIKAIDGVKLLVNIENK